MEEQVMTYTIVVEPYVLIEMIDEADCLFVSAWRGKADEAESFWSETLNNQGFRDRVGLLHAVAIPDLAAFALEILRELKDQRCVTAQGLYADENGLFSIEFALMVHLGFFFYGGESYRLTIPDRLTLAAVKQAALGVLSAVEDWGDDLLVLQPERHLHTLSKSKAEELRSRLMARRRFRLVAP
jgi:hypothetical protein